MEVDDTWILSALQGILPEQTLQLLHDHVLHPSSTLRTISSYTLLSLQRLALLLQPVLAPIIDRVLRALQDSPDVVVLGFLLAFFVIALQFLLWMHRTMLFFTRLAFRAVVWTLIGLAFMAAWQRGPEAVIRDVVVVVSKMVGYAAVVKDIWLSEYQKYDAQTRAGAGAGSFGGTGRGPMGGGRSAGFSGRGGSR
ncbi:hypothetical protein F5Y19DRAFT_372383 [Xylariaceae sp. FL1651]|nr:hypothetical protein F5Y19DRAFT_372383 [Xylariaceae sp. FL1651]